MFNKAKTYRDEHITKVDSWSDFEKTLDEKGGFISAHWDGTPETEEAIKEKTKATIRCIPLDTPIGKWKMYFDRQTFQAKSPFCKGILARSPQLFCFF
jgi:prolyl-tRNA synthetase